MLNLRPGSTEYIQYDVSGLASGFEGDGDDDEGSEVPESAADALVSAPPPLDAVDGITLTTGGGGAFVGCVPSSSSSDVDGDGDGGRLSASII